MLKANLKSWLIWFAAGLFYLFEFIHRVVVSVMIPELSESFAVGSALLSSLSAAYFFAYAFAQIPVGILLDRYGTRLLLTVACLAITLSSCAFAYTQSLTIANYCRIIIGLGSAFAFVGCLKLAASWFPAHKFAFVVGLTNLLGVLGAVLGGGPAAYTVESFGWRNTMFGMAAIGLALTIVLWQTIRDSKTNKKHTSENTPLTKNLKIVIKSKQTWLIALFASCMVAPIVTYSELWGVTYLTQVYTLDRSQAANIATITFIGIGIGGPTIGWLSDYYRNRSFFMGIGLLGALISICLILFGPILAMPIVLFLHVAFGFFTSSMLLCFSLNAEATKQQYRATTVAFTNCLIMISGAALQIFCGYLLEFTDHNFAISFLPVIACYVLALLCFIKIKEPACRFAEES